MSSRRRSSRGSGSGKSRRGRGDEEGEETDLYEILGVERDADESTIKRAYRKKAIQWHPDKNPEDKEKAEEMFKRVAHAYEVLSDTEKRDNYDRTGSAEGFAGSYRGDHVDPFDLFRSFFGGSSPFFDQDHFDPFESMSMFPNRRGSRRDPFGFGGMGMGMSMGMDMDSMMQGGLSSSSSFSSSSRMGGGMSTSTSTTTRIVNGQRVTETVKTVTYPNGETETTRSNTVDDVPQQQRIRGGRNSAHQLDWW